MPIRAAFFSLCLALCFRAEAATVVSLVLRQPSAHEANWLGRSNWDQLGIVEFTRSGPVDSVLRVYFQTSGTARRGNDYALLPGEQWFPCECDRVEINFRDNFLDIPAGASSILLGLRAWQDYRAEGEETAVIQLVADQSASPEPAYTLGASQSAAVTLRDEPPFFDLLVFRRDARTLSFNLAMGAMVQGEWQLQLSHDLRSWIRVGLFSPGNVAAFAEDVVPAGENRPRFYRAALIQPPE